MNCQVEIPDPNGCGSRVRFVRCPNPAAHAIVPSLPETRGCTPIHVCQEHYDFYAPRIARNVARRAAEVAS